jgi:nucleoside 2-deoxyribosyltransferase
MPMPDGPTKKAFVLMPFDQEFKPIYDDLIKPALESAGYEVERADSFMDQRNILRDVVKGISEANLVIADLTAVNPNVFYELGLCHGLRVPTVLITQSLEEVPFDLRSYRVITYSTQFDEVYKLKDALREIGERHQRKAITFESPVTDFLQVSSRSGLELSGLQERSGTGEVHQETPSEEEAGYLDWLVGINTAGEEIAKFLTDITHGVSEYATRMTEHGEAIQAITGNPNPGTAAHAHKIALLASKDMKIFTQMILERRPSLEKQVETLTDAFPQYINWMQPSIREQRAELGNLREVMVSLADGTRTGIVGSAAIRESTISLKNQSISRDLNLATRNLAKALDEMISSFEKLEAFCLRVLPIIDAKLAQLVE